MHTIVYRRPSHEDHGERDAGPVYHPLPGRCQASYSLDAAAGVAGRQGSSSWSTCAD